MSGVISAIWDAIVGLADWLLGLVKDIFTAIWDMLVDAVCYVFDEVLDFVVGMASSLDVGAFSGSLGAWSSLPSEVLNVLGLIGLGDCFVIISAAIVIRLVLQLIPFVRLGS